MARHSHEEYASAAGAGGLIPIPMGQKFKGCAIGTVISTDAILSSRTGATAGYKFEIKTTDGKTLKVVSGIKMGDLIQRGQTYEFNYRVSKKSSGGYCFSGRPTPLSPSRYPSFCQRSR